MKKLSALLVMFSLFIPTINSVHAAGNSVITFDGEAEKFINTNNEGEVFNLEGMYPGETRTETLTLVNNDYREMNFYMNSKILDEFGNETSTGNMAYDFNFKINGEDLFDGLVGGENNVGEGMMEDNILIATLAKGESATLQMSVTADGDTMDNTYQNATGLVQYTFSVEYDDEAAAQTPQKVVNTVVQTVTNRIEKAVKTGDPATLGLFGVLLGGSVVGIFYLVATRKKKEEDQNEIH